MASRRLSRMLPWNASAACGPGMPPITTELYEYGPLGGLSGWSTVSRRVRLLRTRRSTTSTRKHPVVPPARSLASPWATTPLALPCLGSAT